MGPGRLAAARPSHTDMTAGGVVCYLQRANKWGSPTANPIARVFCANSTPASCRGAQSGSETEGPVDQGHGPHGLATSMPPSSVSSAPKVLPLTVPTVHILKKKDLTCGIVKPYRDYQIQMPPLVCTRSWKTAPDCSGAVHKRMDIALACEPA